MSVNSIADGMAAFNQAIFKSTVQLKPPVKDATGAALKVQDSPSKVPDAAKAPDSVILADNNPVREMSRVSESYDAKGNVITKYTDSSNNIIYQTPSESLIRTRELMDKAQAGTSIKA